MQRYSFIALLALFSALVLCQAVGVDKKHHHHHHHKHHKHLNSSAGADNASGANVVVVSKKATAGAVSSAVAKASAASPKVEAATANEAEIVQKVQALEKQLATKEEAAESITQRGKIEVNAPLPADFSQRFVQASALAAGVNPAEVQVTEVVPLAAGLAEVIFKAPADVVRSLENQAGDATSKLATGSLQSFLIAKDTGDDPTPADSSPADAVEPVEHDAATAEALVQTPQEHESGIDIDTAMPYGELEPFGREDTAQELTESAVKESDEMVDQLERAEVAEEKRSVFRALTRLRGAAITSFDGIARSQTGNIDEYNKVHQWRSTHPLHHLADEESDISKWAFPDNADF